MSWLRSLTVDQWSALTRDYPVRMGTPREQAAVAGVYIMAAIALTMSEYGVNNLWRLLPMDLVVGSPEQHFARKMGWVIGITLCYIVPTALYARLVLGMKLKDLGLTTRGFLEHTPMYLGFFAIVFPFVILASADQHFQDTYPLARLASRNWTWLLLWEIAYGIQFLGVEFIFRGFLLFGAVRFLGPYVVPIMCLSYCMLHFGKPWPETLGSIIAGFTLGVVALRTRSILGGVCIHAAVAWSMDFMALYRGGHIARLLSE